MDAAGVQQIVNLGGNQGAFEHFAKKFRDLSDRFIPVRQSRCRCADARGWHWRARWSGSKAARMDAARHQGRTSRSASASSTSRTDRAGRPAARPTGTSPASSGIPVLVHTGEPTAFWQPIDPRNERYAELLQHPDWSLHGQKVPSQAELMAQRERLIAKHPDTIFIGAHMGMNADDLEYAARLLDRYPNYYLDMSTAVSELRPPAVHGAQVLHPLPGPDPVRLRWRLSPEPLTVTGPPSGCTAAISSSSRPRTSTSSIRCSRSPNRAAGASPAPGLPPDVLEKIYRGNALRLIRRPTPGDRAPRCALEAKP